MPKEQFPVVPFGEWTVTRPFTAPGLFVYRHMQAEALLHFPDFGGGDMTEEQRKAALVSMVNVHRPLAALVLFLGVVGLEDFIRDIGARLADVPGLLPYFPNITQLRPVMKNNPTPYARPDKDPAPLSEWSEVNALYQRAIGICPFPVADIPKLHDLALIRHTVAHHAALVRPIDAPRFRHWDVPANLLINPPVEFVQKVLLFLHQAGREFETAVAERMFSEVIADQPPNWHEAPSELVKTLVETFNWFGKLVSQTSSPFVPWRQNYEQTLREQSEAVLAELNRQCIEELRQKYAV